MIYDLAIVVFCFNGAFPETAKRSANPAGVAFSRRGFGHG
jgi:hypothetical protein